MAPGVYVPGKPFQPRLTFIGKAYLTVWDQVGSCLDRNHQARLEMFATDKHSSLIYMSVNYGHKKFYNIGPWCQSYMIFYFRNLRMFAISWSVCPWQAFPAQSNICGLGKQPTLEWGIVSGCPLRQAPALITIIKLGWKSLPGTKTLAFLSIRKLWT